MKKITLLCCCLLVTAITFAQNEFVTTWQTTTPNESITIPTTGTGYSYTVDWGDSSTSTAQTGNATHSYATAGTYTVKITGTFPRIYFNFSGDKLKIKTIEQWGTNVWSSMNRAFYGCANLTSNATDVPDLSGVTDMSAMFAVASAFNGNIGGWDVSSVTNMKSMFSGATAFNGNISSWNVSSVTNMFAMFNGASAFNGNISGWNVSSVTDMDAMFNRATVFNGNISNWNVSSVIDMGYMFYGATAFNQDLSSWNVSSVTDMSNMFYWATAFNQNLGAWDISSITYMSYMFIGVTLSTANYDNTLIGWSTLSTGETQIPTGITFDGGNSTYCAGETAKNTLTGSPYNWTITDGGISSSCTLGVDDYNMATSLELYPNPSTNMIYLSGNINKLQKISIYSILGRRVMVINKNFKAINIEALNTGIYFVKLITNKGIKTIKLVKE